jgi:hypothetical protein
MISKSSVKTICNKKDILLNLNNENKVYSINFDCKINNLEFKKIFDFNIYHILFEINKDLIEDIKILKQYDDNNIDLIIVFKKLNSNTVVNNNLNLPVFYIYVNVNKSLENNKIVFTSEDHKNNLSNEIINICNIDNIENCERLFCEHSELIITQNQHTSDINVNYNFKFFYINNSSTFFMNFIALLIKKVFYKLKLFIDNQNI